MELTRLLKGKSVFLDTAPFIYFIEINDRYHPIVKPVISLIDAGQLKGITSVVTLLEVMVQPLREGKKRLVEQYKTILLNSTGLATLEITHQMSETAARLRARYGLRTPDALQLAAALAANADYFLTNDTALKKAKEIKVLILEDFV